MYQNKDSKKSGFNLKQMKPGTMLLAILLILSVVVTGTVAFIMTYTEPVENVFHGSDVTTEITEKFDGELKKNVNAKNTGDTTAYLRIKLVTYRVDKDGNRIGGQATIPPFTPGANWIEHKGFYYYTLPVAPDQSPATDLAAELRLQQYTDADGGKQVIEVLAEAIQSEPAKMVGEAWNVSISENSVTDYVPGN